MLPGHPHWPVLRTWPDSYRRGVNRAGPGRVVQPAAGAGLRAARGPAADRARDLRVMAMARMRAGGRLLGAAAVTGLVLAALPGGGPAGASDPGRPAGNWSKAWTPATGAGAVGSVACAPGGYCVVVAGSQDVLIARDGVWGQPQPLDLSALGNITSASLDVAACPSAGNCLVAGHYLPTGPSGEAEPFAVTEHHGRWGQLRLLPVLGSADPNAFPVTAPAAVACSAAGNCVVAVWQTTDDGGFDGGYVIAERNGAWGKPVNALVHALACARRYCIGTFEFAHRSVMIDRGGTLTRRAIPGLRAGAYPVQASCLPGGSCTVAGYTLNGQPDFSVTARNGTWAKVRTIPGTRSTSVGYVTTALSCPAPGTCTIGGFANGKGGAYPFTAAQHNGTWTRPRRIPGMAALHAAGSATLSALSCTAAGQCAAGGTLSTSIISDHAYLATQTGGRWATAFLVPGITDLEQPGGNAFLNVVTCWAAAHCIAGGYYDHINSTGTHPFLTTQR